MQSLFVIEFARRAAFIQIARVGKITAACWLEAATVFNRVGDRRNETIQYLNAAAAQNQTGETQAGIETAQKALALAIAVKDRIFEIEARAFLSDAYNSTSRSADALVEAEAALKIALEIGDREWERIARRAAGNAQNELGRYEESLASHQKSLAISAERNEDAELAIDYLNIGLAFTELGQFKRGIENYAKALPLAEAGDDLGTRRVVFNDVGVAFLRLGYFERAKEFIEKSTAICRLTGDRRSLSLALANLGAVYTRLKEYDRAIALFDESLPLLEKYKQNRFIVTTKTYYGLARRERGEFERAVALHTQAVNLARTSETPKFEARAEIELGADYLAQNQTSEALSSYERALEIAQAVKAGDEQAAAFDGLMKTRAKLDDKSAAIFYGKQSVNLLQTTRNDIRSFDKETQALFVKDNETTYRKLADLLIADGRIPEAQAVLDLLKDEELGKILQRSGEPLYVLPYSQAETDAMALIDRLAASGKEIADLKANQKTRALTAAETEKLNKLETTEIPAANKALRVAMQSLAVAAPDVKRAMEAKMKDNVQNILPDLGGSVAALYTVFGQAGLTEKDKTNVGWIILVTPEFRKAYPIDTQDLQQTVFKFRDVLRSTQYDPQPLAEELYKKLFLQTSEKQKTTLAADLETYFGKSKDRTLMWSLDGVLRYVPMAALHDGNGYLVEKYRNVVFNTASLGSLKDATKPNWEVLGFGVSEAKTVTGDDGQTMNFAALTGAESELKSLVKNGGANASAILPGTIKLNKDFTKQSLISGVREGKPVVHIATHFAFNTANEESSFLLLGDGGKLEMSEFEDFPNLFAGVDLLSLSACDTATGGAANSKTDGANGKEVEGFAYVAQTLGAKSVMASLWQVSDEGTKELMLKFYEIRQKNPQMPKGEALREAQMMLLTGKIQTAGDADANRRSKTVNAGAKTDAQIPFKKDPEKPFAHPFYWSPFVLIGNWR